MTMPKLNAAGTAWERQPWQGDSGQAPVQASSGNVAAASAVATMPAVAGKLNYISGFDLFVGGATAGSHVDVAVSGLAGGTRSFPVVVPAGATLGGPVTKSFDPPLPASAVNTAIVVTMPTLGTGNTKASAAVRGFAV